MSHHVDSLVRQILQLPSQSFVTVTILLSNLHHKIFICIFSPSIQFMRYKFFIMLIFIFFLICYLKKRVHQFSFTCIADILYYCFWVKSHDHLECPQRIHVCAPSECLYTLGAISSGNNFWLRAQTKYLPLI